MPTKLESGKEILASGCRNPQRHPYIFCSIKLREHVIKVISGTNLQFVPNVHSWRSRQLANSDFNILDS